MNYIPVIGLEIHLQVKTKTKMFSREPADYFQEAPNTYISPVSFGLPGALPVPNKTAFRKAIKLALALNCKINQHTKFDRKNYFYPDLSKGYQISQFDKPIGYEGYVEIELGDDARRVRLQRLHLEEDTAKSTYNSDGTTYIDYNKSGIPLIEMVTYPDFESIEEVLAFAKRLRQIVRYTDTSDAEMQKGQMRFELNISLKKPDENELPNYKVEVKNIGSISVLEKVILFEIDRQSKILDEGKTPIQETRGLKDMSGETVSQRIKEGSADYRYFPEPDIPPIHISDETINELRKSMPELPVERKRRYIKMNLEPDQAEIFVEDIGRGKYFDECLGNIEDLNKIKEISKWVNTEVAGVLLKKGVDFSECHLHTNDLVYLIDLLEEEKITGVVAKKVIEQICSNDQFQPKGTAEKIIMENNWLQSDDEEFMKEIIQKVIAENAKVVKDIKKNPNAIAFLVGQVMKQSRGKLNPKKAQAELEKQLL